MIIEANELRKVFGSNVAVNDVSFSVEAGESVGLLGPNGAGKSTTISMILSLLKPDTGSVKLFGEDTRKLSADTRSAVGFVPQDLAFFPDLSGLANVTYWGRLYGLRGQELETAVREAMEFTGLWDRRKDTAKDYSGGMQRRLNISCGIVHKPKLLIMDEPTVGVDPQSRNHILESVRTLRANGSTVVYTSHYMEEIQALCDRVIIMDNGEVVADGMLDDVLDQNAADRVVLVEFEDTESAARAAEKIIDDALVADPEKVAVLSDTVSIQTPRHTDFSDLARRIFAMDLDLTSIREEQPTLETVFLNLTGKSLRD